MLSRFEAGLLLHPLGLPTTADPDTVYHRSASYGGAGVNPYVHLVWFRPSRVRCDPHFHDALRNLAVRCESMVTCENASTGSSEQAHTGGYLELGTGAMPGRGRECLRVGDHQHHLPFSRSPELSRQVDDLLSRVLSTATAIAQRVLPRGLVQEQEAISARRRSRAPQMAAACQYPRRRSGWPLNSSHQVVLRASVVRAQMTPEQREEACLHDVADLHLDRCDGNRETSLGSCSLYYCIPRADAGLSEEDLDALRASQCEALRHRDMAVFPPIHSHPELTGHRCGSGIRAEVMQPGWVCMLYTRTDRCPHCGISPVGETPLPSLQSPAGLLCGRLVTYSLAAIDALLDDCVTLGPCQEQTLVDLLDANLRARASDADL